jgi:hypothetical protein
MTVRDFVNETRKRYESNDPVTATRWSTGELFEGIGRRVGRVLNFGNLIWEYEWEVLVILDACRYDLFRGVCPEYDWLPNEPGCVYSAASQSEEWMERHFTPEYRGETSTTALVSANVFTDRTTEPADWAHLDELWKHSWNDNVGVVLPESTTDSAIKLRRASHDQDGIDRMIVWYMQPHWPFVPAGHQRWNARQTNGDYEFEMRDTNRPIWYRYRDGDIPFNELWSDYADNLRFALESVDTLRHNIDTDSMVITSDHGNALGEWGMYGHPKYVPNPILKKVPWVEIPSNDEGSFVPDDRTYETGELQNGGVQSRLEDLGYV